MKNICDWNNCSEIGEYKAPVEKDNSKKYRMLCLEHVKEFNKNWNYFSGMNDDQVLNFLKSDMIWHKPTQSFSSSDNFFKVLWNNTLRDELDKEKINEAFTQSTKKQSKRVLEITKEKLVSIDFNHNSASAIVDSSLTSVVGKNMGKISAWYDNEWGFSNRMCDIAEHLHKIS